MRSLVHVLPFYPPCSLPSRTSHKKCPAFSWWSKNTVGQKAAPGVEPSGLDILLQCYHPRSPLAAGREHANQAGWHVVGERAGRCPSSVPHYRQPCSARDTILKACSRHATAPWISGVQQKPPCQYPHHGYLQRPYNSYIDGNWENSEALFLQPPEKLLLYWNLSIANVPWLVPCETGWNPATFPQ